MRKRDPRKRAATWMIICSLKPKQSAKDAPDDPSGFNDYSRYNGGYPNPKRSAGF